MKPIRCIVRPDQVDKVIDVVKAVGATGLTVTGGREWQEHQQRRIA